MIGRPLYCSFCGLGQHEVEVLVASKHAWVCDACVVIACRVLYEHDTRIAELRAPDIEGRRKFHATLVEHAP